MDHPGDAMPEKGEKMSDVERAKRIREAAREAVTDNDPASFDRAFERVVQPPKQAAKTATPKK